MRWWVRVLACLGWLAVYASALSRFGEASAGATACDFWLQTSLQRRLYNALGSLLLAPTAFFLLGGFWALLATSAEKRRICSFARWRWLYACARSYTIALAAV